MKIKENNPTISTRHRVIAAGHNNISTRKCQRKKNSFVFPLFYCSIYCMVQFLRNTLFCIQSFLGFFFFESLVRCPLASLTFVTNIVLVIDVVVLDLFSCSTLLTLLWAALHTLRIQQVQQKTVGVQVYLVRWAWDNSCNFLRSVHTTKFHESWFFFNCLTN